MGKFGGDGAKNLPRYTKHANNQAIKSWKSGHGVAIKGIADALKSKWIDLGNSTYKLVGKYATLIMREDGTIITMWATCRAGWRAGV